MTKNARAAVLDALLHVSESEGYSNIVLDKTIQKHGLEQRDSAFAAALFYGVLERRITLDYVLAQFSKTGLKKLSPPVKELLRMGAYQILYMQKVPESAAVNEAVNLAKQGIAVKASGFINGVLRTLIRQKDALEFPDELSEKSADLSVLYSCPEWLISLWNKSYGIDVTKKLLKSLSDAPPIYIRVNNLQTNIQYLLNEFKQTGVKASAITHISGTVALQQSGNITALPGFKEGWFHVQDLASQICCAAVNPQAGERVLDVCSAPGGKAFTMAERMNNEGELLAFDKYKGKVRLIQDGAKRLGLSIIQANMRDASDSAALLPEADKVLCDVPCSGFGIIRRKPEIRYKEKSTLDSLPDLQYLILCNSAKFVKTGGKLFYSTCTLNPAENAEVAERFLREHSEFKPCALQLPQKILHVFEEPQNQMTLFPFAHGSDGFFIASFQRR